jgi:hypothetical protein
MAQPDPILPFSSANPVSDGRPNRARLDQVIRTKRILPPSWVVSERVLGLVLTAILIISIVVSQGISFSDSEYPTLLTMAMSGHGSSIDPQKGFLLEGLLGDGIGMLFLSLGLTATFAPSVWWLFGVVLLTIVLIWQVERGSLNPLDLLIMIAFSRMVDTLALFVGKFDPFLLAFLALSTDKNRILSGLGLILSAFLHPFVAIVSAAGIVVLRGAFDGVWLRYAMPAVLISAVVDLGLFKSLFPTMDNRGNYLSDKLDGVLLSGFHWGLVTFVASLVVPFLMLTYFKAGRPIPDKRHGILLMIWVSTVVLLSCLITFDHTRVSCLLTFAPALVYLRSRPWREVDDPEGTRLCLLALITFFLARLVIPHVVGGGLLFGQFV